MNAFNLTSRISVRFVAVVTIFSMLLSAFPVAFFVALADTSVSFSLSALPNPVGTDVNLEFVRLTNTSVQDVDLTGWKLVEGAEEIALAGLLEDGASLWACANTDTLSNGGLTCAYEFPTNFALVNGGGSVKLVAPNSAVIVEVTWGDVTASNEPVSAIGSLAEVLEDTGGDSIAICHATGNEKNPYVAESPNINSFFNPGNGHDKDTNDITPPFFYDLGEGVTYFPGSNWDTEGQEMLRNGCGAPKPIDKAAELIVITGDTSAGENQPGWLFNRDTDNATPIEFNDDEKVIGIGALNVLPLSDIEGPRKFIGEFFTGGLKIADTVSFSYDFKIGAGGDVDDDAQFYLNVYANFASSDPNKFYDCKYDVVPTVGSTGSFTTVTFDPTQSYPVTKRGDSPFDCPAVPADMDNQGAGSVFRMFAINTGDATLSDAGLDGYFDNVILDTTTKVTTYDFEPKKVAERNVNIVATKIVCEDESLLPNDGYTMIDANTAAAFLASTPERTAGCSLASDWQFQWALGGQSTQNSPDNAGELGSPWVTTAATDDNGQVTVVVPASTLSKNTQLSVREVVKDSHIPFTGTGGSNVSAEMYCHTDAANFDNLDWIKGVSLDNTYYCVAWNVPKTAEVTMCKLDDEQQPLKGWQLSLLGSKAGEVSVLPNGQDYLIKDAPAGDYVLKASGTYVYRPTNLPADAAFSERLPGDPGYATAPYQPWLASTYFAPQNYLGVQVNGTLPWGEVYSPSHTYYASWNPTDPLNDGVFKITDTAYGDNRGSVLVEAFAGYTGVTGETGCVTFKDVPYGTYTAEELLQQDWANVEGLGSVVVDAPKVTHNVINKDVREVPPATIVAHKIVCTDESELPNGLVGSPITADTAADWVEANKSCSLVPDWQFEWAEANVSNPDNSLPATPLFGAAGAGWNTFGPTDANGMTTVNVPAAVLENNAALWVREVLKDGYIPFTYGPGNMTNEDDYTAEMYCHTDVKNFDNFDRVDGPKSGGTYHCVAWNHEAPEPLVCDPRVNLLANASFEATPVVNAAGWDIFDLATYPALGWAVEFFGSFDDAPEVASLELQKNVNGWTASTSNGAQYAELDSDWQGPAGTSGEEASVMINQVIPTIPGAKYTLSWDFSPRPGTTQTENDLAILVNDAPVKSNSAAGGAAVSWTGDSYTFTASGNTTKIAFADDGTPNSVGTLLDNTSLVCGNVAPTCSLEMVSDTTTLVVTNNDFAVETYDGNGAWTASIPGATWIWDAYKVANPEVETTRIFEETFTVNGATNAILDIAADNTYRIYVNGDLFEDRTDIDTNFQAVAQQQLDITSALIDGENTVRFEVINRGVDGSNYLHNPAGLLFKLTLDGESNCAVTTNRDDNDDEDNNDGPKTYVVDGYKWNDEDGDGFWDEDEDGLADWVIYATNDEDEEELMTTTDEDGYYKFELPEGEWVISEGDKENWYQTTPALPGTCTFNLGEPILVDAFLAFISVIPSTVQGGECEFGNEFRDSEDEDPEPEVNGRSSGGGSPSPRCELDYTRDGSAVTLTWETSNANEIVLEADGEEIYSSDDDDIVDEGEFEVTLTEDTEYELTVSRGSRDNTCSVDVSLEGPTGQVLGEQVSIVPLGAADAGAGGTAPVAIPTAQVLAVAFLGRTRNNA